MVALEVPGVEMCGIPTTSTTTTTTSGGEYSGREESECMSRYSRKTMRQGENVVGNKPLAVKKMKNMVGRATRESLLLADIRAFDKWNMLRETKTIVKMFDGFNVREEVLDLRRMCMECPKTKEEVEDEEMRLRIHAEHKAALLHRISGKDSVPSDYVLDDVRVRIGSNTAARNLKALRRCGVTHVLNVSTIVPSYFGEDGIQYLKIPIFDDGSIDIRAYFGEAFEFLDQGCQHGCVLVHCCAGQSRSVAFVIGYLMSRKGMSYDEAFSHVKRVRMCAAPNEGFMEQLKETRAWIHGRG